MRCKTCKKPIKENTDGNNRYCQGHSIGYEYLKDKKDCNNCKKNGETICGNDTKNMNCFERRPK